MSLQTYDSEFEKAQSESKSDEALKNSESYLKLNNLVMEKSGKKVEWEHFFVIIKVYSIPYQSNETVHKGLHLVNELKVAYIIFTVSPNIRYIYNSFITKHMMS